MTEASLSSVDETKLGRALAVGVPIVTVGAAIVAGVVAGIAMALLCLAAGVLFGTIAILWASLRVLSGDAPLPPELEQLDHAAQGVDALSSRRKMLVRALKDLENERDLGKMDDADYAQISGTYREELKAVLRRIDESLEPHRAKAEEIARAHLAKVGLSGAEDAEANDADDETAPPPAAAAPARRTCPKCSASNEADAKFCKACATALEAASEPAAEVTNEA